MAEAIIPVSGASLLRLVEAIERDRALACAHAAEAERASYQPSEARECAALASAAADRASYAERALFASTIARALLSPEYKARARRAAQSARYLAERARASAYNPSREGRS